MRVCVLRTLPYCPINNYRPEEDCGDQANLYQHCDEPSAWRTSACIHQQSVPSRKEVAGLRGAKHNHYQWFSRINHQNKMLDKSVGMGGRGMGGGEWQSCPLTDAVKSARSAPSGYPRSMKVCRSPAAVPCPPSNPNATTGLFFVAWTVVRQQKKGRESFATLASIPIAIGPMIARGPVIARSPVVGVSHSDWDAADPFTEGT